MTKNIEATKIAPLEIEVLPGALTPDWMVRPWKLDAALSGQHEPDYIEGEFNRYLNREQRKIHDTGARRMYLRYFKAGYEAAQGVKS